MQIGMRTFGQRTVDQRTVDQGRLVKGRLVKRTVRQLTVGQAPLKRRNRCETLGNMLNCPPSQIFFESTKCLQVCYLLSPRYTKRISTLITETSYGGLTFPDDFGQNPRDLHHGGSSAGWIDCSEHPRVSVIAQQDITIYKNKEYR